MIKSLPALKTSFLCVLTLVTFIHSESVFAKEEEEKIPELAEDAKSAIIMEVDTGQVLYNKNENEKLPPASMTKIMTMLLVMEALEKEDIQLDEQVTASEHAASMGGSQIFLEQGEQMTVHELLKGVAVASGNDASVALAEHIAGTEEKFIKKMNDKAEELGLENTHFNNTTGLTEKDHYTTARDLAVMSQALLQHEKILEYTSIYEDYLRQGTDKEFWLVNTNRLVKHYDGVDGLKTGFTSEAKYNLTATAQKDGMRVITVLMGAESPKKRNKQTTEMLDYGFQNYQKVVLAEKGEEIASIPVEKGKTKTVPVTLERNAAIVLPKGKKIEKIDREIDINDKVIAPAEKGSAAGVVQFYDGEKKLTEKELVLDEEAQSASWYVLFKRTLSSLTGQLS
ncbi:D-alanyl-D-alanine carboxypeptidase family protein [Alteribacillus bidgolensis]|uniref:serine-type D-Ala-D-Ala carboxypeptidase n=1 Tax=Alteribacillus bidgolensis TaxID=930129 RepID=A0A1G8BWE1_9BACI|nr:D-Ala-D-Ala carboxypeptidase DacF. Serine peptidase. MEROPS family S11 [Alteribacillus bidgolensis]